jgi:hypothetical protein
VNHQFSALSLFELTGDVNSVDDERVDTVVIPADPVAKMVERAAFDAAMGKTTADDPAWDELLGTAPTAEEKRANSPFKKGTIGYKLGIVRTEEKTDADGAKWLYGYDANDELVDARVIGSVI